MTNRLEDEAIFWIEKGYGSVARQIEHAITLAHAEGAPEYFGENHLKTQRKISLIGT